MINGAAVLQEKNKILAGDNPCFFFGEKEMPRVVFCGNVTVFANHVRSVKNFVFL